MKVYFRLMILSLAIPFIFTLNGCSSSGGSGNGGGGTSAPTKVISTNSFAIGLSSVGDRSTKSVKIFDYSLSIKRGTVELMDKFKDYISVQKNSNGSLSIILKKVTTGSESEGLSSLAVGDVVTLDAKGYTAQQIKVTQAMLNNDSTKVALKPIESRQTYSLADMINGSDSVTPRHAFGASTKTTEDSVVFETSNKQTTLIMPKMTYNRLARKISRLPRSGTTTQVHLDMTSVDPKTEHDATIGDFSYDVASEPASERTTNSADDTQNSALESVVMADLKMTTDAGDEIHCFGDGVFDPQTNTCSDSETATLKMKIPESQFKEYAFKYNDGDKVVPLYSYNKSKATWVRQLDNNGDARNGELVLEDNNNNAKADAGDVLYIVGKVGHFSWWNGDYPTSRTCLNVKVDLTNYIGVSHILVKGVDYSGREFKKYITDENVSDIKDIPAKENSLVSVALIMSDGSIGDSTTHATGEKRTDGICEDVEKTLVAPLMHQSNINVNVTDLDSKPLKDAWVSFNDRSYYTDSDGKVDITTAYKDDYNTTVGVYYYRDGMSVRDSKIITVNTQSIDVTFKLDIAQTTFTGKVVDRIDNIDKAAAKVDVLIRGKGYCQFATTDKDGRFSVKLPTTKVKNNADAKVYIDEYNDDYAFYQTSWNEKTLDVNNTDLGTFKLEFTTHKVTGRVTDTLNNGIADAYVYSYGNSYRSTITDENGYYKLMLLGPKDVNTSVRAYTYKDKWLYSPTKYITTAVKGSSEVNFKIEMRKATIKGTVVTAKGVALENMRVYWSKDYYNYAITDKNGNFELQTYNGGDGYLKVYDRSSWKYLDFDKNINKRDVKLDGVKIGEVKDAGNMQVVAQNFAPVISDVTVNPANPLADVQFAVNINAYDPDGDALTYTLVQRYGNDATIEDNNSTVLITAPSGYYYFKATVTDEYGNSANRYISLYIQDHAKPVIESVNISYPKGLSYFDKSEDLNISVNAYSSEGNTLSYKFKVKNLATGDVTNLESTDNNATLSKDIADGRYILYITASDLYNKTSMRRYITVDSTVAPVIDTLSLNNTSIANGGTLHIKTGDTVAFDVNLTAESANQNGLSWYWYVDNTTTYKQDKSGVKFDTAGYYYGYVSVEDSRGRSDYRYFYISVAENQKPVINAVNVTPDQITKNSDNNYTDGSGNDISDMIISVDATDSDSPSLTYTFSNVDLDNTTSAIGDVDTNKSDNIAKYNLAGLSVGRHSVKVTVSDGIASVSKYKTFTILENQPPKIMNFIVPVKVKVGKTIRLQAYAEDPNGEAVTYKWEIDGNNKGTLTDANSKFATFLAPNKAQDVNITLTVSDGVNKVSRVAQVQVIANQVPAILYLDVSPLTMTTENTAIALKARYGDVDGTVKSAEYTLKDENDTVVKSFDASASDEVQNEDLGVSRAGVYKLILTVVDNNDANATSVVPITVTKPNSAPIITALTSTKTSVLRNEKVTLNVVASDPDGDAITVDWSVSPSATLTKETDKVTFSADSTGEYTVTVIVTDAKGAKASKTIKVSVVDTTLNVSASSASVKTGESVTLTASFSTGHTVPSDTVWSFTEKPAGSKSSITANGTTSTFTPDVAGTYKVKAISTLNGVDYAATTSVSATDSSTTTPDVEGVVTSSNGDTLSGVEVRLYNKADSSVYDQTTTTDSDGNYSFSDVPAGTYYLVIYAGNDYIAQTKVITVE